jgi:site-specific recombinase XerD
VTQIGKGDRARVVGIGARTMKALDRYLRARAEHRDRALPGSGLCVEAYPHLFLRVSKVVPTVPRK